MPERIQLRRTEGWRKPEGAIVVARPTRWGNPWRVDPTLATPWSARDRATAVELFRDMLADQGSWPDDYPTIDEIWALLRGHDLACWCPIDQPCHADVLLELANGGRA